MTRLTSGRCAMLREWAASRAGHPVELGVVGRREVHGRDPWPALGTGGAERHVQAGLDEGAGVRVEVVRGAHASLTVPRWCRCARRQRGWSGVWPAAVMQPSREMLVPDATVLIRN